MRVETARDRAIRKNQAKKEMETERSITEPLNPAVPAALGLVSFSVWLLWVLVF